MITRPLDLASKLRPEPRNLDALFFVNAALIVLFFELLGSRFVLAPSLGVDFELPRIAGSALVEPRTTSTLTISVKGDGLILADPGQLNVAELRDWLNAQGKVLKQPVLLVRADVTVSMAVIAQILSAGRDAGFDVDLAAEPVVSPRQSIP